MKKLFRMLTLCLAIACLVCACLVFFACEPSAKYTSDRYDAAYSEHERQTLSLCLPHGKTGTLGLILVIHGGGWIGGDKEYYVAKTEKLCTVYGYATAAINYHYVSNDFCLDDILQDITLSLQKIKDIAAEHDVDLQKVMLTGNSAGGHLSLLYAYKCAENAPITPVAVADYCGPTDLTDTNYYSTPQNTSFYAELFSLLCGTAFDADTYLEPQNQALLLEASPVSYVTQSTVPTLICHGDSDEVVPYSNATILQRKLQECGVKHDLVTYKNSGHSLGGDKRHANQANKLFAAYAEAYLG